MKNCANSLLPGVRSNAIYAAGAAGRGQRPDPAGQSVQLSSGQNLVLRPEEKPNGLGSRVARWYLYFRTKNPNLGEFWSVLQWKMLVCFMSIWYTLRPFAIFYGLSVYFLVIWYILSSFGTL
jgi:hypothetical protein